MRKFLIFILSLSALSALPVVLLYQQNQQQLSLEEELRNQERRQWELMDTIENLEAHETALQQEILQLYQEKEEMLATGEKRVFLTFDDGPSAVTEDLLDLLAQLDVKASFFVVGAYPSEYKESLLRRIVAEGHSLGNHSYTHHYGTIYVSREAFWQDFLKMEEYLFEVTGIRPVLTRFPGGSRGSYRNRSMAVMEGLRRDMDRLGYIYVDWNVLGGDVESDDPEYFISEVLRQVEGKNRATVLFHDTAYNREILEALPVIVQSLREQGYQFAALDPREYFTRY